METDRVQAGSVVSDGGTEEDQQAVLALHYQYLAANDAYSGDALREIWVDDSDALYFNTNGFTYYGVEDWLKIWAYNGPRTTMTARSQPGDVWIRIRGDLAVLVAERVQRPRRWDGPNPPSGLNDPKRYTYVCERRDGAWKVVHVHFSTMQTGPRPETAAT